MIKYILFSLGLFLAIILPQNTFGQESKEVYYIVHKMVKSRKSNNGNPSEDSYKTDMLPATFSSDGYKNLKKARKKMWSTPDLKVRSSKYKLSAGERVVILQYQMKNSDGYFNRIAVKTYSKSSKKYGISPAEIANDYKTSAMDAKYYQGFKTLYDGVPFSDTPKERKMLKENVKKATAIGVRG